jgi:O-antigen/teichoic acid export membrane protein
MPLLASGEDGSSLASTIRVRCASPARTDRHRARAAIISRPRGGTSACRSRRRSDVSSGDVPKAHNDTLSRDELKQRVSAAVVIVASRDAVILVLGVASYLVLARLLTPHDFGLVAIGMSIVLFTGLISDGGLGGGLIRRPEPPTRQELGALTALQLTITAVVAGVAFCIAPFFGTAGWVTAIMVASMPLVALQFPGRILLERTLDYRRLARVELSQVVIFQLFAIGTVAAGFGVWGFATATLVRAAVGAVMMAVMCPHALAPPQFRMRLIRPLMAFGVRFQAINGTTLIRDQSLNWAIGGVAGLNPLGLWALARRLMEVPYLLFHALLRISFPTMSRLVAAKEDTAPLVERALGMTAVAAGLMLTPLAAGAPGLIPGLFGSAWSDASTIIPGACAALMIAGSVEVAMNGYLYAVGDVGPVLRAANAQAILWFAVTLPLLPIIGVSSIGLGWCVASIVQAVLLTRATKRRLHVRILPALGPPLLVGLCIASVGWWLTIQIGRTLAVGLVVAAAAAVLFVGAVALLRPHLLQQTYRYALTAVRERTAGGEGATRTQQDHHEGSGQKAQRPRRNRPQAGERRHQAETRQPLRPRYLRGILRLTAQPGRHRRPGHLRRLRHTGPVSAGEPSASVSQSDSPVRPTGFAGAGSSNGSVAAEVQELAAPGNGASGEVIEPDGRAGRGARSVAADPPAPVDARTWAAEA